MDINNPSTDNHQIETLSPEWIQRYIEMRQKLDVEANTIHGITSLLSHYKTHGHDRLTLDPNALGKVNQLMNEHILNIWEILDDFIHLDQAKSEINKVRKN